MGFLKLRGVDISDADAAVGDVSVARTFYSVAPPRKNGAMPTVALAAENNAYPAGRHVGDAIGLKHVEPNLQADFIVMGVNIFGTIGTSNPLNPFFPATIGMGALTVAIIIPNKTITKSANLITNETHSVV